MQDHIHERLCEIIADATGARPFDSLIVQAATASRKFLADSEEKRLRDEFAMAALKDCLTLKSAEAAHRAYVVADAMMKAREQ